MSRHPLRRPLAAASAALLAAPLLALGFAAPAQAATSPACIVTPTDFATALLHALGDPTSSSNVSAIVAWAHEEGGNWENDAQFNPLDTTEVLDGSTSINSVGVQSYSSWDVGVTATVDTLDNGHYPAILSALAAGTDADAVSSAVAASPWGTPDFSALIGVAYNPASPPWQPVCSSAPGPRESAVVAPSGTVAVFSIDSHGDLYETNQATPTSTFNAWGEVTTAGNLTGTPSPVVVPSNGTVASFNLTTDGQVEIVGQTASGSTFTNVGIIGSGTHAAFVAGPTAVIASNGTVAVFALGSDGYLYETNQTALGAGFAAWTKIGSGGLSGTPAVIRDVNGTLVTLNVTAAGQVQLIGQTTPSSTFANVGVIGTGGPAAFTGSPAAVVASNGTLVVFATGTDGYLYETNQTAIGAGFTAWTRIGSGGLTATPSAARDVNGTIVTFSLTTAGQIELIGQTTPTSTFTSTAVIGTGGPSAFAGTPDTLIASNGTVVVFALGSDGNHYETNQTAIGSGFAAWTRL